MRFVFAVCLLSCVLFGCSSKKKEPSLKVCVDTSPVSYDVAEQIVTVNGTIVPNRFVDISLHLYATSVKKIHVQPGQYAESGALLMTLQSDEFVGEAERADADYDKAEKKHDVFYQMFKKGAISQTEYSPIFYDMVAAKGAAHSAKMRAMREVRAPFAGQVGVCHVREGSYIEVGKVLMSMVDMSPTYVDFYLSCDLASVLKIGSGVSITANSSSLAVFGKVVAIDICAAEGSKSVLVRAEISEKSDFIAKQPVLVTASLSKRENAMFVAQTAVMEKFGSHYVYVVRQINDGRKFVFKHNVRLGVQNRLTGEIEVISDDGLSVGDKVITGGNHRVFEGYPVIEAGDNE
jgi:RND family efflux transporter MFP subunit